MNLPKQAVIRIPAIGQQLGTLFKTRKVCIPNIPFVLAATDNEADFIEEMR